MPAQEPLDVTGVEDGPPPSGLTQQQLADEVVELTPEPGPQRNGEASLGPVDHGRGQHVRQGALQKVLGRAVAQPELGRDRRRKLDELVIEQWHPGLERMRHAHPVHLRQDVEREITHEIEVLKLGEPSPVRRRETGEPFAVRVVVRDRLEDLGAEELPLVVAPEEGHGVEVPFPTSQ